MLEQLIEIVRAAAAEMRTDHLEIRDKGDLTNIVTSSDVAVQHFLCSRLAGLIPGAKFYCEEEDLHETSGEYVWIIDPIDGTANFSRGIADCCISVALAHDGVLELGVVYSPWRGDLWYAERGKGAFRNGKRIHVSDRPFSEGLFCTAMSTYNKDWAKYCSDIIFDIYMQSNDTRRFGSAAVELCLLASGIIELYFEMRLQPWDYAAGTLIILEAGGCVAGFDGKLPSLDRQSLVIAANSPASCEKLLEAVHRHLDELPY